jgi:hypothetical protein
MKKNLLLIVFCICPVMAFSQVQKGSKMVGVGLSTISITSSNNENTYSYSTTVYDSKGNSFSFSIYPNMAWFVANGLAIGGSVGLGLSTSSSTSTNTSSTATTDYTSIQPSLSIGPYARYYIGSSTKGRPFVHANFQFGLYGGKSTSESSTGSSSETLLKPYLDLNTGVSFGYEYFISEYVGLYISLGVNYERYKITYDYQPSSGTPYTYTNEYSRFNVPLNVGLQVHIPAKGEK